MMRFIVAFLFLALAFVMQFWLASFGVFVNFILAALIAFAFLFGIGDLIFFILLAIFVVNWQPAWSLEIGLFAAIPLAAYALHRYTDWEAWAANSFALIAGLFILYLTVAPSRFLSDWKIFLVDLAASFILGTAIFAALNRRENR